MEMEGYVISGIKVVNIFEENAASIEKMTNQMITNLHTKEKKILDLQVTGDNLILVLGEKEWSRCLKCYVEKRKIRSILSIRDIFCIYTAQLSVVY